ncbi:MAG: DUF5979 domain-containing protein [Thermoanaerobaculia bacterium]
MAVAVCASAQESVAAGAVSAPGRSSLKDFLSTASLHIDQETLSLEYGFFGKKKPLRLQVVFEKPDVSDAVKHVVGDAEPSLSAADDVTAALTFSLVNRRFGRNIEPHRALFETLPGRERELGLLLHNQPQLYFTAEYRFRRDVAGPREFGALLGWEFSRASLNEFLAHPEREPPGAAHAPRISLSAEFRRTLQSTPQLPPEIANLNSFTTLQQQGFLYSLRYGQGLQRRFDLGITYDSRPDPRSALHAIPPSRERITASGTYTRRISDRISIPLSVVWSERSERLPGRCRSIVVSPPLPLCEPPVHQNKGRTTFLVGITYQFPSSSPNQTSPATLIIRKTIAGAPAGFSTTIHFDVNCSGKARTVAITWPNQTVTITGIAPGSRCSVTEVQPLPDAPKDYQWVGVPIADPPDGTITIVSGTANQVSFRNELRRCEEQGQLKITKRVEDARPGFSGTFHVNIACWSGATLTTYHAIIQYPAPSSVIVAGIPRDSSCTVTETEPLATLPSGWFWLPPRYLPPPAQVDLKESSCPELVVINRAKFCCTSEIP